jgi:hypothetical protein
VFALDASCNVVLELQEVLRHYSSAGLPAIPAGVVLEPNTAEGNSLFAALSKDTQASTSRRWPCCMMYT